ncbi:uncharacterized protein LOC119600978 [Lucilia sericata]|uniref:uncharacterized protein LOC119600978 n=1 Tax=Lucilia sericata TaxID=13632 RepID=UPI0018A818C2|nr:uncharacterized protein LOC119600978 [Lucilia sericata]
MHLLTSCIILLLGLFFCVMGDDDKSNCIKECPYDFKPVCATIEDLEGQPIDCNFGNDCSLEIFTCMYGKKETEKKSEPCESQSPKCNDVRMSFKGSEEELVF